MSEHLPHQWTRRDILALCVLSRSIGVEIRKAVEQQDSLEAVVANPPPRLARLLSQQELFVRRDIDTLREQADAVLDAVEQLGARAITVWDDQYPALLRQISYPPVVLYVRGELQPNDALAIAVVGTRRCTTYGRLCAERFAAGFAQHGCIVVSGLANGIDSIAHAATIDAGGITYAVIASGLDRIGPRQALRLAERIVESGGAIISEYPPGTTALPTYFPQRNRIISGIARAVLVIESRRQGGSLITAQFALDESRDLFAVPGMLTSPTSEGTNQLIAQQKAQLALSPEHILAELGVAPIAPEPSQAPELSSPMEEQVWAILSGEPQSADDIATQLDCSVAEVLSTLLVMEFRGIVRQLPGKQFIRAM